MVAATTSMDAENYLSWFKETSELLNDYEKETEELLNDYYEQLAPESDQPADGAASSLSELCGKLKSIKDSHGNQVLSVGVIALAKSGKSTFLNSLLGFNCMPSALVPETARICRIEHDPELKNPVMREGHILHQGMDAVHKRLSELNKKFRDSPHDQQDHAMLSIRAPIAALKNQKDMPTKLHLIDTPGPNESDQIGLQYQVESLLDGIGAVVYVLDCTKLKTNEEKKIFHHMRDSNPELLKRISERLFFLVNKKDQHGNMTEDELREYVANLVTDQMQGQAQAHGHAKGSADFKLDPSKVMLISAQRAFLSRMVLNGTADKSTTEALKKVIGGEDLWDQITEDQLRRGAEKQLKQSGIPEVEEQLLGFLYNNAGRLQILGTLDDISHNLGQVMNAVMVREASLMKNKDELSEEVNTLNAKMESIKSHLDGDNGLINKEASEVTVKICESVKEFAVSLRRQARKALSDPEQQQQRHNHGLFKGVAAFFGSIASLVDRLRKGHETKDEAKETLKVLQDKMTSKITTHMLHTLRLIEEDTSKVVDNKLKELTKEVEVLVGKSLDVHIEPAKISIAEPSFQKASLSELSDRVIKTEKVVVEVVRKATASDWVVAILTLGGIRNRSHEEIVTKDNFTVDHGEVMKSFMEYIDNMSATLVKYASDAVQKAMHVKMNVARERLQLYCNNLLGSMIQDTQLSQEDRERALSRISGHVNQIRGLAARLRDLRGKITEDK